MTLGASACAVRSHPVMPMRAQHDDIQLELDSVRKPGAIAIELTLRSRSTKPHSIDHGWLTVATRNPCGGGAEVDRLTIDGASGHPVALPVGEHLIVAQFNGAGGENPFDLVLDLEVDEAGDAQCVRAPVVSHSIAFEPAKRPLLAASMGLDGTDLSGLRGVIAFQLGGTVWAGPVMVTGLAGFGEISCNPSTCGKSDDNMLRNGWAIPLSLDLRYGLSSFSSGAATSVLSVGARYSFVHLSLPDLAGKRRMTVHGVQAMFAWALTDRVSGPFRSPERGPAMEMTIPIGVMLDPDAKGGTAVAFTLGFGFRFFTPL